MLYRTTKHWRVVSSSWSHARSKYECEAFRVNLSAKPAQSTVTDSVAFTGSLREIDGSGV